jgi:hypothetical protein
MLQGVATFEEGRTDGAGGVDRGACEVNADEVDEYQRQTDGQTSEVVGGPVGLGCATQYHNQGLQPHHNPRTSTRTFQHILQNTFS